MGPPPPLLAPPTMLTRPAITGSARLGGRLSTSTGSWNAIAPVSYAYAWQRCSTPALSSCAVIPKATGAVRALTAADEERWVRAVVTASSSTGSASGGSAAVGPVAPPSRRAVEAALHGLARVIMRAHGRATRQLAKLGAGRLTISWNVRSGRRSVLVAREVLRLPRIGAARARVRPALNRAGRRLLRERRELHVNERFSFRSGRRTATSTTTFTLRSRP